MRREYVHRGARAATGRWNDRRGCFVGACLDHLNDGRLLLAIAVLAVEGGFANLAAEEKVRGRVPGEAHSLIQAPKIRLLQLEDELARTVGPLAVIRGRRLRVQIPAGAHA